MAVGGEVALYLMFTWLLLHPFPIVLPAHNRVFFWFSAPALRSRPPLFLGGAESCGRIYMQEERQACSVGQSWHCATCSSRGLSKASCSKHPLGSACSETPGSWTERVPLPWGFFVFRGRRRQSLIGLMHSTTWWSWCPVFPKSAVTALGQWEGFDIGSNCTETTKAIKECCPCSQLIEALDKNRQGALKPVRAEVVKIFSPFPWASCLCDCPDYLDLKYLLGELLRM